LMLEAAMTAPLGWLVRLRLEDLDGGWVTDIRPLLAPVGEAIQRASLRAESVAPDADDSGYAEAVLDEACDEVEGLLGVAFVIAQVGIAHTVAAVKSLRVMLKEVAPSVRLRVEDCVDLGQEGEFSKIAVLNAFANYFKHRDEWVGSWKKLTDGAGRTANAIMAAGAAPGSTGNLRTGADAIGLRPYGGVVMLADMLNSWRRALKEYYQERLESAGLLKWEGDGG